MNRVSSTSVRGLTHFTRFGGALACALLVAPLALPACGGAAQPAVPPVTTAVVPSASASQAEAADALGPRPETPPVPAFIPPSPAVFAGINGMNVWLLERHQVPLVSCNLTIPTGASSDPKGKAGLAYDTANMLDEGAGKLGAIDLARALDDIGARLGTDANADASFVSLTVLKRNVEKAFALFGDVVTRPRFEAAEFKRVKDLWTNELVAREKDPDATARVVYRVALFGPDHPYGHPWDGTPQSAKAISLDDVKKFYATAWRPDRATLVCVGDVTQAELTPLMTSAFGTWKAPATPALEPVVPPAPKGPWPKLIVVDRQDAPQAVIAALKPGVAASDPQEPPLWRVNDAIGGSFTSRLNQDLREEHGYTYGARSRFSRSRGPGQVVAWANVVTDKTGDAMAAMLADLKKFADGGLTGDEVDRTRSQSRGELVSVYQSNEGIAGHLAADASLGLPADWEARSSEKREGAQKADLDALAKQFFDPTDAILVVVGPRAKVQPQIDKLGLPPPEVRDAQGNLVASPK
ncbi:MAG TPA: pitrilysin family protein [Polyangiaceae bacterium]|nr:pitrilysin family protein [Polyangiaceae bacterium]